MSKWQYIQVFPYMKILQPKREYSWGIVSILYLIIRAFDIKQSKDPQRASQLILDRSWIDSQYISKMTFQENYNKKGWFKKKNLSYCFFTIPGSPLTVLAPPQKKKDSIRTFWSIQSFNFNGILLIENRYLQITFYKKKI